MFKLVGIFLRKDGKWFINVVIHVCWNYCCKKTAAIYNWPINGLSTFQCDQKWSNNWLHNFWIKPVIIFNLDFFILISTGGKLSKFDNKKLCGHHWLDNFWEQSNEHRMQCLFWCDARLVMIPISNIMLCKKERYSSFHQ